MIAIIAVVAIAVAAIYFIAGGGIGGPEKLDIKKIDPKILRDTPPPRRGEPGYRERTTD